MKGDRKKVQSAKWDECGASVEVRAPSRSRDIPLLKLK